MKRSAWHVSFRWDRCRANETVGRAIIMQNTFCIIAFLCSIATAGCAPTSSVFEFRNSSNETIRVDRLSPLKPEPPCGFSLGPGGSKTVVMVAQTISKDVNITWSVVDKGDSTTRDEMVSAVAVSNYDSTQRREHLVLEYTGKSNWDVRFAKPD